MKNLIGLLTGFLKENKITTQLPANCSRYGSGSQFVVSNDIRYAKLFLLEGCNQPTT
jgi:hypothetical protein